jgi:uncharacterized protein (TIGR02145 family)
MYNRQRSVHKPVQTISLIIVSWLFVSILFSSSCSDDDSCPTCPQQSQPLTVTDIDGNVYATVTIGDQVWMAENLRVLHYRNGTPIPYMTDSVMWTITLDACCVYGNHYPSGMKGGVLYKGFAVTDPRGIAPEGWHIPTDDEWKQLEKHIGMSDSVADLTDFRGGLSGDMLKDTAWSGTDDYGFSAISTGYRSATGSFDSEHMNTYFWSTTPQDSDYQWYRHLHTLDTQIKRWYGSKHNGFSVRCLKD